MSSENGGKGEAAAVAVDPPSSPPTSWKVTEPMQREGGRAVRKNSKKGKRQGAAQQPEEEVNLVSPWIEESDTKHEIDNGGLAIWPGTEGGEKTDVSKPAARKESARKRAGKKGKGNSGATAAAVAVASPEKKANATNTNANANAPRRAEEKADDGGGEEAAAEGPATQKGDDHAASKLSASVPRGITGASTAPMFHSESAPKIVSYRANTHSPPQKRPESPHSPVHNNATTTHHHPLLSGEHQEILHAKAHPGNASTSRGRPYGPTKSKLDPYARQRANTQVRPAHLPTPSTMEHYRDGADGRGSPLGKPLLQWYEENVVNNEGYDLQGLPGSMASMSMASRDSLGLTDEAFILMSLSENELTPRQKELLYSQQQLLEEDSFEAAHGPRPRMRSVSPPRAGTEDLTPNILPPPTRQERGSSGPLYYQTSALYDAYNMEKVQKEDPYMNKGKTVPGRPRTSPLRGRPLASTVGAKIIKQKKPNVLNLAPPADKKREARLREGALLRQQAVHSNKPKMPEGGKRAGPAAGALQRRGRAKKTRAARDSPPRSPSPPLSEGGLFSGGSDADDGKALRAWGSTASVDIHMPSSAEPRSPKGGGETAEGRGAPSPDADGEARGQALHVVGVRKRKPFVIDKAGSNGHGVPIGFSDRRHRLSMIRHQKEQRAFYEIVRQRRVERKKQIRRKQRAKSPSNLRKRKKKKSMKSELEAELIAKKMAQGSVGTRIALNSFQDSSGKEIMMFATPPPLPPNAPPWPWEPGFEEWGKDQSTDLGANSESLDTQRARDAAEEGARLAAELLRLKMLEQELNDGPEDSDAPDDVASIVSSEGPHNLPCFPAEHWDNMHPDIQMLEAEIACWESDVRQAASLAEIEYALPEDFEHKFSDEMDHEKNVIRLNAFLEWFGTADEVRKSFMEQEVSGAIMHVPCQSAASVAGIDIDLLVQDEEEVRAKGEKERSRMRKNWRQGLEDDDSDLPFHENEKNSLNHIANNLKIESEHRRCARARLSFTKWYRNEAPVRREFLEHRNHLMQRAVEKLVRWGRNRVIITLDAFGPMVDELTLGDEIGVPWDDLDEQEKEMEIMSALCDRDIRQRAEQYGIALPPVIGVIDGSGLDTEEEIAFAMWFATADGVRSDFFMREMEAAMRDAGVMASAIENEYVRDDAESTDVQVPNLALKEHEVDQDEEEVRDNFKNWLVSEDEVVQYNVEVPQKEAGVDAESKNDEGSPPDRENQATVENALGAPGDVAGEEAAAAGDSVQSPSNIGNSMAPEGEPNESAAAKEGSPAAAENEEEANVEDADPVKQLPGRERRGAPAGRRAAFEQFKSWYINDTESRKKFLENRRTLFKNALKQRIRSNMGLEDLPDIWAADLELEDYEDDCTMQEAQMAADEISWYKDKWEILAWYSAKALEDDDKLMQQMEHQARRDADRAKREAMNLRVEELLDQGMEEFNVGDAIVEENAGGFVEEIPEGFEVPEGWEDGDGLLNNDEEYFAMIEKEEAEREFVRKEKEREKKENETMEAEEKQLRAVLWARQLEELQSSKKAAVFNEVLKQRRLTLERYYDPDGITVAERQKIEQAERLRNDKLEKDQREQEFQEFCAAKMELEDTLSCKCREQELHELEVQRQRALAREEKKIAQREMLLMDDEDSLACAIIEEEERVRAYEEHQARLAAIMHKPWKPATQGDDNPILFVPFGLDEKRVMPMPYFQEVKKIPMVRSQYELPPVRKHRSAGGKRPVTYKNNRWADDGEDNRPSTSPIRARPPLSNQIDTTTRNNIQLASEYDHDDNAYFVDEGVDGPAKEFYSRTISQESLFKRSREHRRPTKRSSSARRIDGGVVTRDSLHKNYPLGRPSTTPVRGRLSNSSSRVLKSRRRRKRQGLPEVKVRREPRLGALGSKAKLFLQ